MESALLFASGALALGFVLRATVRWLQVLYIPAAVLGGIIGLLVLSLTTPPLFPLDPSFRDELDRGQVSEALRTAFANHSISLSATATCEIEQPDQHWLIEDDGQRFLIRPDKDRLSIHRIRFGWNAQQITSELRTWPGWLISVIFAGLLLERPAKSLRQSLKLVARQGIVVWIIIVGEITVGLIATWLLIRPMYPDLEVPGSFGQLIETGFAGGHGTAAAMGRVFEKSLEFPDGYDLGFFFATAGLIYGVISGIVLVNLAVRRGWTSSGKAQVHRLSGLESRTDPQPMALGRVRSEVIDPFVFQCLILGLAFAVGIGLQWAFMAAISTALDFLSLSKEAVAETIKHVANLPLFMFTLMGGLLVREFMSLLKLGDLIDAQSIHRIIGGAMEYLIVAAIASMKLAVLAEYFGPVVILLGLGFVWTGFCLLVVARRLLPKSYWFELGILNYGMSTGTTAQGMMLLRIVDKDLDSGAAEDYALAAPLSAPFIGGGVITLVLLPWLLQEVSIGLVVLGLLVLMAVLYGAGLMIATPRSGS